MHRSQAVLVCVVLAATACGQNGTSLSPSGANVAGQWTYTEVLTEVVGGGCSAFEGTGGETSMCGLRARGITRRKAVPAHEVISSAPFVVDR